MIETLTKQCLKNTKTLYCDDNLDTIRYIGDAILSKDEIREICKEYIEEKEKKEMNNKVLDLYYERKKEEIKEKYKMMVEEEYNNNPAVKEYKELIGTFEASLAELANRHNTEAETILVKTGYRAEYLYELNESLRTTLKDGLKEAYNLEIKHLELLVEEVRAMLAFSDNDEHRMNVLKQYDIVDRKGKLNI